MDPRLHMNYNLEGIDVVVILAATEESFLKSLIVEDDATSRMIMQEYLEEYGPCDAVSHGHDALKAFEHAYESGDSYQLVCLDIMMPDMNGHEVLVALRQYENDKKVGGHAGARIVMTTALGDAKNVVRAFKEQCEGYLVKPITKEVLRDKLQELHLIDS